MNFQLNSCVFLSHSNRFDHMWDVRNKTSSTRNNVFKKMIHGTYIKKAGKVNLTLAGKWYMNENFE